MIPPKRLKKPRKPVKAGKNGKPKNKFLSALNVFSYALLLAVLALLAFVIISNKFSSKVPVVGGYSYLKVATGSMTPTIPVGKTILIKNIPFESLTAPELDEDGKPVNTNSEGIPTDGDVISFYAYMSNITQSIVDADTFANTSNFKRVVITHRIYKIVIGEDGKRYINTKGDNPQTNGNPDEIKYFDQTTQQESSRPLLIPEEDYIGAWQQNTPKAVMSLLSFALHPLGMVVLVILPLSIILLIDLGEYSGVKKKKDSLPPPPRPKKPPKRLH